MDKPNGSSMAPRETQEAKQMKFWKYNIGDKIILDYCNRDGEKLKYIVVDRYVDGLVDSIAVTSNDTRKMYVLYGDYTPHLREEKMVDKLIKDYNGVIYRESSSTNATVNERLTEYYSNQSYYQEIDEMNKIINFIHDRQLTVNLGKCVEYISRSEMNDPDKQIKRLMKARWFLNREIEERIKTVKEGD